jgi:putative ABC transport system permease protein
VDLGLDYRNVLLMNAGIRYDFNNADARKAAYARGQQFVEQTLKAVSRVPGVEMAGTVSGGVPLTGNWSRTRVELPGKGEMKGDDDSIDLRTVSPSYLPVLRIPLLKGRHLSDSDAENTEKVVVINQAAARKYWGDADPLGQRIKINRDERVVVGVVGDIRHLGPEKPTRQEAYVAFRQNQVTSATFVMRTSVDPLMLLPAVKTAIRSVDPGQRLLADTVTLEAYMDRLIAERRFSMALLALFGGLGLVIAAVGIYGVMGYIVAQRTNEIGVRMALGATAGNVVWMVLRRAGALMIVGLAIGSFSAWALSAKVQQYLFEVQPNDLRVFGGALLVLAVAGLVASAIPARRAAAVDPLTALRHE